MRKAVQEAGSGVGEGGVPARRRAVSALSLVALPALLALLALVSVIALGALPRAAAAQSSLGSGTLLVAGTTLAISPESQTCLLYTSPSPRD